MEQTVKIGKLQPIVIPEGELNIKTNGIHDVTNYSTVNVDVPNTGGSFDFFKNFVERKITTIIPENLNGCTIVGYNLFKDCKQLTSIDLPSTITTLQDYAFQNCYNLESVNLPNSISSIGKGVFQGCTRLTEIVIPSKVESLSSDLFYQCSKLAKITIPKSVKKIHYYTFDSCSALATIIFTGTTSEWNSITFETSGNNKWNDDIPATQVRCSNGTVNI